MELPGSPRSSSPPGGGATRLAPAALAETHTAVVVFVGDRAYKLKKPVSLGFLDFSSREARRAACHREVELNRRLSPDVYLGVADVLGADGAPCDHLVVMRRLDEASRLSTLARSGADLGAELRQLARLLASFHGRAERSATIDAAASPASTLARWETNAARLLALPPERSDPLLVERSLELARSYLVGRGRLLARRVRLGRSCDGHGDLLADDIFCLADGPRVLDCLEFDDELRYGDGLGDVAFLAMDLERLGRVDLATALLEDYARFAGDTWPASLAHLHVAYRAQVRALVAAVRAEQGDKDASMGAAALLRLAVRHLERGQVRLVLVGGPPGTGKSTLAAGLGATLGAVVLRSDELRKQAAGLDVNARAAAGLAEGIYNPASTAATYASLLEHARTCLSFGESVVLDATFSDPGWRGAARAVAAETHATLHELRCALPAPLARSRLLERAAAGTDASDATVEVAERLRGAGADWPEAAVVDTSGSVADSQDRALALLDVDSSVGEAPSLRSRP